MAERTVATRAQDKPMRDKEETRSQEQYITPPVDIYEIGEGLAVKADLPGVAKEGLDVRVENNLLTIRGKAHHIAPGDPVYREYGLVNFFRQFELNEKVDQTKISAELKNGVLTLKLPRAEETKPRKIDVKMA
ncbi:MAG TPA: Hsp20/alpha crystallin family protein [Candidatus Acidoferrales bacterium]|nr:Hsp20/alpha crystallin family protein [Candidatus Acidoferrales bacterium]